jgi:hypothetical protein
MRTPARSIRRGNSEEGKEVREGGREGGREGEREVFLPEGSHSSG